MRAVYNYSGMADVAVETHDPDYHSAVRSLWDNIVNKKYYVTGGVGSGETSEGFGPNYSLRQNAYCESCSSCGLIFFQYKMNMAYHEAKYADLYEETLYNALLGSTDLEGKNFYYTNPLDSGAPRYPWHVCPCCVGNIPRTLLMLPTWMYAKSADSLYVNLFIGSDRDRRGRRRDRRRDGPGDGLSLERQGRRSPSIRSKPSAFSVRIRVPDRSVSALYASAPEANGITSISVNGAAVKPAVEKGYAVISRTWKAGDRIDLVLPLKVQRVQADRRHRRDPGQRRPALRPARLQHRAGRPGHHPGPRPGLAAHDRMEGRSSGRGHGHQGDLRRREADDWPSPIMPGTTAARSPARPGDARGPPPPPASGPAPRSADIDRLDQGKIEVISRSSKFLDRRRFLLITYLCFSSKASLTQRKQSKCLIP